MSRTDDSLTLLGVTCTRVAAGEKTNTWAARVARYIERLKLATP